MSLKFATFRLGKTSVTDIQNLELRPKGVQTDSFSFVVTCTQIPDELSVDTVVFIWLGSDNSKGTPTAWKQGFKGVGVVKALEKGTQYNDESKTTIEIKYIFSETVNRLDVLRENPAAYYWCSALPIIGLDDHSNQTARMLSEVDDRSRVGAFLSAMNAVNATFRADICPLIAGIEEYFWTEIPMPKGLEVIVRDADSLTADELASELKLMNDDQETGVASYRVLGFKYPKSIEAAGTLQILQKAGLSDTYQTEINKGRKLHELIRLGRWGMSFAPQQTKSESIACDGFYQLITYGAPGTGKSYRTKLETEGHAVYRTTFHPDSDYSTFVGAYKPTMKPEQRINCIDDKAKAVKDAEGKPSMQDVVAYDFVPQAFIKAYVDAWQKMNAEAEGAARAPVFLVIEEINRGNCAQIFGDLFQLLDRGEDGYSDYPIDADADLKRFLADAKQLGNLTKIREDVRTGVKLVLPPNLYIRATMNTSDQSLFPIDSAFKRRWEWKYVPIAKPTKVPADWKERVIVADGKKFGWWDFLEKANAQILDTTKSEDKQLGYFFVKAPDATGQIKADRFSGKVLFYLYNDVFKDYALPAALFGDGSNGTTKYEFKMFFDEQGETKEAVVAAFLEQLGLTSLQ